MKTRAAPDSAAKAAIIHRAEQRLAAAWASGSWNLHRQHRLIGQLLCSGLLNDVGGVSSPHLRGQQMRRWRITAPRPCWRTLPIPRERGAECGWAVAGQRWL